MARRMFLAAACAFPVAAKARGFGGGKDLLSQAIDAAGGRPLLSRVKALNWTAHAQVFLGDKAPNPGARIIELGVRTRVEPFVRARSETWLAGKPETARTLIIEPDGGFVERGGQRTALPERQTLHERQQYAIYGYMLLAQAPTRLAGDRLIAERPGIPPIGFRLEGPYLAAADYEVVNPEGEGTIAERLLFEGALPDQGVHWPQTITILQNQQPYFILDLDTFSVELA
jgi:hypothetical protein